MVGRCIATIAAGVLVFSACGSSDDDSGAVATEPPAAAETDPPTGDDPEAALDDLQDAVDDIADDLEATQDAVGGGGATLVANGQTWVFPSVLCAFGEDQIGQPGAVFNMSAIADGLQLYASIDDNGESHSLSLNDIQDFENPSVALTMDKFVIQLVDAPNDFLQLDGKQLTADVVMIDDVTDLPTPEPAQLTATCP